MVTIAVVGLSAVALDISGRYGVGGVVRLDSRVGVRVPSGRLPIAVTCGSPSGL